MSTFTFRGHEVFYRREGTGAPMVFLHNGGTSHRTWEPLIERYAADYDVIAPDMLGFGRSGHHLRDANRDPDQMRVLLSLAENAESFAGLERKPEGVPVCVIWGKDNKILKARDGAKLCAALQPDREVVIPDAGHLVILERPKEVAAAIDVFLAEHPRVPVAAA